MDVDLYGLHWRSKLQKLIRIWRWLWLAPEHRLWHRGLLHLWFLFQWHLILFWLTILELCLIVYPEKAELLLLVVEFEVIKELRGRPESVENRQHFLTNLGIYLLAVSSLACWAILVEWILDVNELRVWDIFDLSPFYLYRPWPFALLLPEVVMVIPVINCTLHLGYSTEVLRFVNTEE